MSTIIRVEQLTVGYGDRPLLRTSTSRSNRGEVFVILGGSGSGKSTLLKHMIGLYPPLAGRHLGWTASISAAAQGELRLAGIAAHRRHCIKAARCSAR